MISNYTDTGQGMLGITPTRYANNSISNNQGSA